MNIEIEQEIVNQFVQKSARKRVVFELSSPKKRNRIWKLDTKFDKNYMTDVSKLVVVNGYKTILEIFESYGANSKDNCYLLNSYEGNFMPLGQALRENIEDVLKDCYLIYWRKGKIAFWEGELSAPTTRYILKK